MATANPTDTINSLARLAEAAVRLMAEMHRAGKPVDSYDLIGHMRANLNHVEQEVRDG